MPPPLHGRIVHRFQLPSIKKTRGKRRVDTTPSTQSGNEHNSSPESKEERDLVDKYIAHRTNCGFIFISEDESSPDKEYLLSLPNRLIKTAYDAVRLELKVVIRRYTEFSILGNLEKASNGGHGSMTISPPLSPTVCTILESYELDLCPIDSPENGMSAKSDCGSDVDDRSENNLWTLAQFWRKERVDFQTMKNSRPKFSILATVDAISPIVALDPTNPFALVEVYDKENTNITSVVVLHGNQAMSNHAAISPLDTIVFCDVVYKPWAVHKVIYEDAKVNGSSLPTINHHLLRRIPSHVFVATRSDSVSWNRRHQRHLERSQSEMTPIITPVHLVTSISGEIYNVETQSVYLGRRRPTVVHFLDMFLFNQSTRKFKDRNMDDDVNRKSPLTPNASRSRCRLYLSYLPLSVALQYSLRKGAIIQANNVHLMCSHHNYYCEFDVDSKIIASYGACLRSSLVLLRHSGDITLLPAEDRLMEEKQKGADTSANNHGLIGKNYDSKSLPFVFENYVFRRINQTYLQEMYFDHVSDWEHRNFPRPMYGISKKDRRNEQVPRTWISNILLESNCNQWGENRHVGTCDNHTCATPREPNQRIPFRNPYTEFFCHSFSLGANSDEINIQKPSCTCYFSIEDRKRYSSRASVLLDLNVIRTASQRYFENHISGLLPLQSTSQNLEPLCRIQKGFRGSLKIHCWELYTSNENDVEKESEGNKRNDDTNGTLFFVGGFVSELHKPDSSAASIADGACQIPIVFDRKNCDANINDFIMGKFDGIMISCLCLGKSTTETTRDENNDTFMADSRYPIYKSVSLPALNPKGENILGNCSLVSIHGFLFLTAIQIHCSNYQAHKTTLSLSKEKKGLNLEDVAFPVESCLALNEFRPESLKSVTLMGMLTRCRFHRIMSVNDFSKSCRISLSSFKMDTLKEIEFNDSCLQALELTVSVVQSTARTVKFNQLLDTEWPKEKLNELQKVLALSFWGLGCSGRTCALTFGGTEDIVRGSSCSKLIIKVTFPSSSLRLNKLGHICSLCSEDCLDAFLENHLYADNEEKTRNGSSKRGKSCLFDFVHSLRPTTEMLHRRPCRRNILGRKNLPLRSIGELSAEPSSIVPLTTLADLLRLIHQSLRSPNQSQKILNPSLVRRISKANFLSVSFCQAQCYCTRCFCSLVRSSSNTFKEVKRSRKRKNEHSSDEPSFWHLPRPDEASLGIHRTSTATGAFDDGKDMVLPQHIRLSRLQCPKNDCPKSVFGIKWECSGILDDSTGQATLYADGDAALTLLGMPAEAIQVIEEGVWSMTNGKIRFTKSIPPPRYLRNMIIEICAARGRQELEESAMTNPMRLLPAKDRAIYLLERHCRSSSRPRRLLDYYVRCKPLVSKRNEILHLRHTTIDSFFEDCRNIRNGSSIIHHNQVATYTLPSLKLELVDCGVCSHERIEADEDGM